MENNQILRYSADELKEFEDILNSKLAKSKDELNYLKRSIMREDAAENRTSAGNLEDGAGSMEKEQLNQLAARAQKFIADLERALFRIKNGTYGVCKDTGKLISKERLRAVPHTQQSMEAKMNRV
ncbi:DnaK suppressor protein [Bernardetia litoralis DSM 6794]|uniref:DnaK suppressor protein n=1 Tax=Bernardetia litoralis (strain ATCC 23117 / DSM 6794 / NBRC 15988 / NCIMB 1366 / Fx l1 / Sio-4) TaxID=880071 RepID=I4AJ78_BERLS|nr:TraR/DksA C4-type zinc finger protein [Bernardetia litoralis]AFM04013.1 DnaK suppressor protein [Bernardetia litoralis DSM 6794]